ncbi:MAG TPA: hypothetical protein VFU28_16925 [Vicinamibacterales bacterium]|nr:hypothetical protein [Vicinamibacterales bacterium]
MRKNNRRGREHNIAHHSSTPLSAPSIGYWTRLRATFASPAFALAPRAEVIGWHIRGVDEHPAVLQEQ